jgi:hypothetical protein
LIEPESLETLRKKFVDNQFMIYTENFFKTDIFNRIQKEAFRLWKSPDSMDPNCNLDGQHRIGGYVNFEPDRKEKNLDTLHGFLFDDEGFRRYVSGVNGGHMFPADFPIEVREYGPRSQGMRCHSDLLMYRNATWDLEFAYTLDNAMQCTVQWQDALGRWQKVIPQANSLTMVRPNAAVHCVSCKPRADGAYRTMLKFIYTGDVRKAKMFWDYTDNTCGHGNPNVMEMEHRRTSSWLREPPEPAVEGAPPPRVLEEEDPSWFQSISGSIWKGRTET